MNFGDRVFVNTVSHVETMADLILEAGIKPELEVFDMGHIEIAKHLLATKKVHHPPQVTPSFQNSIIPIVSEANQVCFFKPQL